MKIKNRSTYFQQQTTLAITTITLTIVIAILPQFSNAWTSEEGDWDLNGFIDQTAYHRFGTNDGLSKNRTRAQLEFSRFFLLKPDAFFSEFSIHGTLRASYDSAYDLNDQWGDSAGGAVTLENAGGPIAASGTATAPASPLALLGVIPVTDRVNWGDGFGGSQFPVPPGFFDFGLFGVNNGNFGYDTQANPNRGMRLLGSEFYKSTGGNPGFGGVQFAYPVRPCNIDPRGCIDGYLDYDEDELRSPEFSDKHDWIRELYMDASIALNNGDEINFRVGRQQVVWGRTDLFRVLDQVNPVDFSIQNIYEEFEDSRIPTGIFSMEYRAGASGQLDDLNFQFIWTFEKFRPHNLGQGGEPYAMLTAGNLLRSLSTCWHYGCTVGNFSPNNSPLPPIMNPDGFGGPLPPGYAFAANNGLVATDFAPGTIGIRQANLPDDTDQYGIRVEGVYNSIGFSLNALSFYQQLPSLHGGSDGPEAINPFITEGVTDPLTGEVGGTKLKRPYLIAFDIEFPKVNMVGGSLDFYLDSIKSSLRMELAYTTGEEFINTLDPRLYSESNVVRWVVGWDRQTFIPMLNKSRSFLLSAQVFGQHLTEHERISTLQGDAGFVDWKENYLLTFLMQGYYLNDRVQPRLLVAYDTKARAGTLGPAVDWIINDNFRVVVGANIKIGSKTEFEFDDLRSSNQFPPYTDPSFGTNPATAMSGQALFRSAGNSPLGIFQAGPIGTALDQDEFQLQLRYQF
jgi:Protein of unknown function (DUF1302)